MLRNQKRRISIAAMLFYGTIANAQQKYHAGNSGNAITVNAGLGAIGGFAGAHLGAEYEHTIKNLSLTAQVALYTSSTFDIGEFKPGDRPRSQRKGWFIAPGVRYHPIGQNHKADIGLGLSLPVGTSNRRDQYYPNPAGGYMQTVTNNTELFTAVLGQFTTNFKSNRGFLFGLSLTAGGVISQSKALVPNASDGSALYLQFGLRMGGWW